MFKKAILVYCTVILILFCSCRSTAPKNDPFVPVLTPSVASAPADNPMEPEPTPEVTSEPTEAPSYDIEILNTYANDDSVRQLLAVIYTGGTDADVTLYVKDGGRWKSVLETAAFVGRNGIDKAAEGDKRTPTGDFAITGAFGICPNPGTSLSYINITDTTYACSENCEYYNQIIDTAATGHSCRGERMISYAPTYNYGLIVGYNSENIYPLGSAIFVHCKGSYSYTSGCIALSEADVITVMKAAEPGMRIYIGR